MSSEATDIADFVSRFRYLADNGDTWSILEASDDGMFWGDCEDFGLTVLWLFCGKSWLRLWWMVLTFQAALWHCRSNGQGHVALWLRGHGWIDNIYPNFGPRRHSLRFPYIAPLLALALLLKWKL